MPLTFCDHQRTNLFHRCISRSHQKHKSKMVAKVCGKFGHHTKVFILFEKVIIVCFEIQNDVESNITTNSFVFVIPIFQNISRPDLLSIFIFNLNGRSHR